MDILRFFFSFRGRLNRAGYWRAVLIVIPVLIVVSPRVLIQTMDTNILEIVREIVRTILTFSLLGILVKRLHDMDLRGWWVLVLVLIAAFISAIVEIFIYSTGEPIRYLAPLIAIAILLGLLPGTDGPNRFDIASSLQENEGIPASK
jgi:uncharacterized membrane protein YhaH (DUF805 family)